MKIAIVNDVHVGKVLEHQGKIRASSHLMEGVLQRLLQDIEIQHAPQVLLNLGDLIRSEGKGADLQIYRRLIENFGNLSAPVIHLLGNHELKNMPLNTIEAVWQESGFDQKSYGTKDFGEFTFLWLGLALDPDDQRIRFLPKEQLTWLERQLKEIKRPTLIFIHCAIDDHDVNGNFFYEASDKKNKGALFLENQASIRNVVSTSNQVVAVIQAHLHYFHSKEIDGIPYITCPAMGDNICGPNVQENIPEIYTILTLGRNRFTAKAFSGKYCFAGYEGIR